MHTVNKISKNEQVIASFKLAKCVPITRPLEPLHMDLFVPIRIHILGGGKCVFVIIDDYPLFFTNKIETLREFVILIKQVQL